MLWHTKYLSKAADFLCRKCSGFTGSIFADEEVTIDGDVIKKVAKFSHLEDVFISGGVQEAVTARIRCIWKKFKDIASALCKRAASLKLRGSMYKSCVRKCLILWCPVLGLGLKKT